MKKRTFAMNIVIVVLLSALFVGCGKNNDIDETTAEKKVYKAQYHDFTLDENEYISSEVLVGDTLYMLNQSYHQESGTMTAKLQKMKLTDYSVTSYPLELEEKYMILGLAVGDEGIWFSTQYTEWDENYEKLKKASYMLMYCDFEGNVLKTIDITDDVNAKMEENYAAYIPNIAEDEQGNVVITNCESFIMAYDKEGNKVADITENSYGNGFVVSESGEVYYSYMDSASWQQKLSYVDTKENKLGENILNTEIHNAYNMYMGAEQTIWLIEGNSLNSYDIQTKKKTEVLNWLDYDVNGDKIDYFGCTDEGKFVTVLVDYEQEKTIYEIVILEESEGEVIDKVTLTYATFGTDSEVTDAIIRFNKNSEKYRIQVKDYADYDDYETSMSAYNQAILDGTAADIVNVQWSDYKSYARKGLYADLGKLMDNDSDIRREDYFENVLKAYEVDGKLCAIPVSFSINTLTGKSSVWGTENGIEMKEIEQMIRNTPKDVVLMDYITKNSWLYVALQGTMDHYIDWTTGNCSFDSEEFISLLEIANTFPSEYDYDEEAMNAMEKYQSEKVLLENSSYYAIADYQITKALFGEKVTAIGYPGAAGNGGAIGNSGNLLAISDQCQYMDGAWEFIKYMLSEDYQTNHIYFGNPIHKGAFEKKLEEAAEAEYYTNEKGEKVESPKMTYGWDNVEISVYHATEEDMKEYREIVEGAVILASYDEGIMTMITEEVEPFFAGQKNAKDVASIIQSRVKIYVNENR